MAAGAAHWDHQGRADVFRTVRGAKRIKVEWWTLTGLAAGLAGVSPAIGVGERAPDPPAMRIAGDPARLVLRSLDIAPGGTIAPSQVYDRTGCRGGNVSPGLSWASPPAGTRSFALLMLDLDAGWWHWAVFDIPAQVTALRAGAGDPGRHLMPPGAIQVRNDFGSVGYGGPCPPPGPPHHYRLTLYALRMPKLGLDASATPAQVDARVRASALAQATLVGLYGR
jgi:Raf kinase inhibitor-like YbhB/YbcL family protein